MSETYTVQPGEYMEMIADQFGFRDYHLIYDHPGNALFKAMRPNPDILLPGDQVFIPDKDPAQEPAETDKKHKFVIKAQKITLILYIRRNGKPFAGQKYTLKIGAQTIVGKTAADGLIQKEIPLGEPEALLTFPGPPSYTRKLNIGFLHPITTVGGRKMRLNNLGFGCGKPDGSEDDAYTAAVRGFQKTFAPPATGKADNDTIERLRAEYDMGVPS